MFKFVVLCALVAAASAGSKYGGQSAYGARGSASRSSPTSDDANAQVNSFSSDVHEHGFQYAYDTTNAIQAAASGDANGDIKGDFSWISPEGEHVSVQYVADENGYQPNSALLPTPPPIPEAILKALEYIRTHPSYEEPAQGGIVQQPARKVAQKTAKGFGRRF